MWAKHGLCMNLSIETVAAMIQGRDSPLVRLCANMKGIGSFLSEKSKLKYAILHANVLFHYVKVEVFKLTKTGGFSH